MIVDPFSSGKYLLEEFEKRHIPVVAIISSKTLCSHLRHSMPDKNRFVAIFDFEAEFLHHDLYHFNIGYIIAGCESGVMLAEQLQEHYGFPGNGSDGLDIRRDKYAMQERLKDRQIRSIKQIASNNLTQMITWRKANLEYLKNSKKKSLGFSLKFQSFLLFFNFFLRFPVVVKPLLGGGTEGVTICYSDADIESAFKAQYQKVNVLGVTNDKLLLQEFLHGTEYVVDSVSHDGEHVVCAIWEYSKKKDESTGAITYEWTKLLPARGSIQDELVTYVHRCLNALSITHGPSHAEVMYTPDGPAKGPCLVEEMDTNFAIFSFENS